MTQTINNEELGTAIAQGFEHAQTNAVPTDASEHLAQFVHTVTTNYPEVLAAAAAAFSMRVAKIVLCIVAALSIGLGAYAFYKTVGPGAHSAASAPAVETVEITPGVDTHYTFAPSTSVVFEGGAVAEHINPQHAYATTDEGTIEHWTVVNAEGAMAAQGEGADTGEALTSLPAGNYTLSFSISDGNNATAQVQRDFTVR